MIYLLFGNDDFQVHEELARIQNSLGPQDMISLNTVRLAGARLTFPELQQVCETVPFLAPARLVIVEGLLARFERGRAGRSGTEPSGADGPGSEVSAETASGDASTPFTQGRRAGGRLEREGDWQRFGDYAPHLPDTTHLVLLESSLSRANPLRSLLAPVATVRELPRLRGQALEGWVRQRAAVLGCPITPAAVRLLIEVVGDNLWILSSELDKLSLYAEGLPIQPEHVRELVPLARETSIFALIDAVTGRQLPPAQRALHNLLRDGAAPPYVLFMLARQFRLLLLAKVLGEQGLTGSALMGRLGIRAAYPFQRTVEQARSYSAPALEATLRRLLDADVAMKTGKQEDEIALELLVADLCRGASGHYQL